MALVFAVLVQEAFRFGYYRICTAAERRVAVRSPFISPPFLLSSSPRSPLGCGVALSGSFSPPTFCMLLLFGSLRAALTGDAPKSLRACSLKNGRGSQALTTQKLFCPNSFDSVLARSHTLIDRRPPLNSVDL
eukprot:2597756-Rhodomonas_salina.2